MTPSRKPRTRGEKFNPFSPPLSEWGSPPHVRGKAGGHRSARRRTRITPAYAGKSSAAPRARRQSRDHPRVCGEKPFMVWLCVSMLGSPPRMRGKAATGRSWEQTYRITPAYAGKSVCVNAQLWDGQDHPRVCGEKTTATKLEQFVWGITPAYAGKSAMKVPPWSVW